jgi:hypothetical protein
MKKCTSHFLPDTVHVALVAAVDPQGMRHLWPPQPRRPIMAPRHEVYAQAVGRYTPHGIDVAVERHESRPRPPVPQPDRCVLADAHEVRVAGEEGGRVDGRGVAAQAAAASRRDGPQGGWGFCVNGEANAAGFHVQVDGVFGRQQVPQSYLGQKEKKYIGVIGMLFLQ